MGLQLCRYSYCIRPNEYYAVNCKLRIVRSHQNSFNFRLWEVHWISFFRTFIISLFPLFVIYHIDRFPISTLHNGSLYPDNRICVFLYCTLSAERKGTFFLRVLYLAAAVPFDLLLLLRVYTVDLLLSLIQLLLVFYWPYGESSFQLSSAQFIVLSSHASYMLRLYCSAHSTVPMRPICYASAAAFGISWLSYTVYLSMVWPLLNL